MAETDLSGVLQSHNGFIIGPTSEANPFNPTYPGMPAGYAVAGQQAATPITTAIVDSTATTLATITAQNVASSAVYKLLLRSAITTAGHIYDSTRVAEYNLTVTRVPGAALVAVLSAVIGAQIATSAGGQTLTTALSLAAVSGAVGAVNTIAIQVTNVNGSAGITESQLLIQGLNGAALGITVQ